MRINKNILSLTLGVFTLMSCNDDHDYKSNDPDRAPSGTIAYYDVNDLYQNYTMFYKPSHGWVGDAMPYFENGVFHVFYLQDTRPAPATFHPWYKATTSDFLTYKDDGEMIACGADNSQEDALGTGGVFKHNGTYYAFYTAHNADLDPHEMIYLATSKDLNTWEKQTSFAFGAPNGYDRDEFRDPIIIEEDGSFKMLLSTRADVGGGDWKGVIAQFTSTDLLNWSVDTANPFFYVDSNEFMVECPDVFVEGDYQYLIYSGINSRLVHYKYRKIGTKEWQSPTNNALDGIMYYAAKTASNGADRYLFGWVPTRVDNNDYSNLSWGGSLLVHQIKQNQDGTLSVVINNAIDKHIVKETELKVTGSKNVHQQGNAYSLKTESDYVTFGRLTGITKINLNIKPTTSTQFGVEFGASGNRREAYTLQFDTEKKKIELNKVLRLDNINQNITSVDLSLSNSNEYSVTILVENSICALYVNQKLAFTSRIYLMNQNAWGIYSNNGEIEFSDIKIFK